MNKIEAATKALKETGKLGIMAHIVAGYPSLEDSKGIAETLLESVEILEVQIPFSDPIADGPVIAGANAEALEKGVTVNESLEMIGQLAAGTDKPILIMTYFNIIHHYGVQAFCKKAKTLGVQGLIVPDYPFDEDTGNGLLTAAKENDLALIQVMAPTTKPERMKAVAEHGSGFIYCMARVGITGNKTEIGEDTAAYLKQVREQTDLPLAVGFGLSEKAQLEAIKPYADIAVIGSALIRNYQGKSLPEAQDSIRTFLADLS